MLRLHFFFFSQVLVAVEQIHCMHLVPSHLEVSVQTELPARIMFVADGISTIQWDGGRVWGARNRAAVKYSQQPIFQTPAFSDMPDIADVFTAPPYDP